MPSRNVLDIQADQIVRAHEWLIQRFPGVGRLFAYPNGSYSLFAEGVLRNMDYDVGALFDHRLTTIENNPLRFSRLRVNDYTSPSRFAAILAGVHPAIHSMRGRGQAFAKRAQPTLPMRTVRELDNLSTVA